MTNGKILDLHGGKHSSDEAPTEYVELRNNFEKRLAEILMGFGDAIRESTITKPNLPALIKQFDAQWQAVCEVAAKKDMELDRRAFLAEVDKQRAKQERQRMYQGDITPQALELLGFRRWSDRTWRTHEVVITPDGNDWRITLTHPIVGAHKLPFVLSLTAVAGIKHLTPLNQPSPVARLRKWFRFGR